MRLTKLEHAALVIEEAGRRLIVDPGRFTRLLEGADAVDEAEAVMITHLHDDHWSPEQLRAILGRNPGARVFGPAGVARAADGFAIEVVAPGDAVEAGPFRLRFFGGEHALIHSSIPRVDNVGVLVNDTLYYAGDSLVVPEGIGVDVLAAPVGAPWLNVGEAMDYVLAVAPRRSFSTHDWLLSPPGKALWDSRIAWSTEQGDGVYLHLAPGDGVEL